MGVLKLQRAFCLMATWSYVSLNIENPHSETTRILLGFMQ